MNDTGKETFHGTSRFSPTNKESLVNCSSLQEPSEGPFVVYTMKLTGKFKGKVGQPSKCTS